MVPSLQLYEGIKKNESLVQFQYKSIFFYLILCVSLEYKHSRRNYRPKRIVLWKKRVLEK